MNAMTHNLNSRYFRTLRNLPFLLFFVGILAYGGSFAWYLLSHFDLVNLIRDVSRDDAFYYFQVARNLADGKFSTFDGGITRTNGYHPVWMLLLTPFYWIFDPETALFGIKTFEIMLVAVGVALIVLAARLAHLPWFLLFAALPMLYRAPSQAWDWGYKGILHATPMLLYRAPSQALMVGMEAANALFVLGLFFLVLILFARNPAKNKWSLAITVFVLPWVRLEYIAISLAATTTLYFIEWSRKEKPSVGSLSALFVSSQFLPLLASVCGILAYFAYNGFVFGGIVPVSGAIQFHWSEIMWSGESGYSFARNLLDTMRRLVVGPRELLVALEASIYFLLVWGFSRRSRNREDWLCLAFLVGVFSLATQHLAKIAQTVLTMHPNIASYSEWYYVPAYLMMALIVPVRCYVALFFIRRFFAPERAVYRISRASVLIIGAIFMLYNTSFTHPYRFVDYKKQSLVTDWFTCTYANVQVANRVLPEGSIVGSWDAGVVGYFSIFPVVNLEGVMNSYDYLRANDRSSFYRKWGITHFATDRLKIIEQNFEPLHTLFEGASFVTNWKRTFKIYHAKPPQAPLSETDLTRGLWERMQPHFDYEINDVGVVIYGRLVQTFPKDCTRIQDKLLVFSWTDHKGRKDYHILDPAKRTREGKTVFCTSAFLLPQDVDHPIAIEMMLKNDYIAELTSRPPNIRSNYDVYRSGNNLIYVKKPCSEKEDTAMRFFLHAFPVDPSILLYQDNFDNLDFRFADYAYETGGTCVAIRDLPRYPIASIRTGQVIPGERVIWSGDFDLTWP